MDKPKEPSFMARVMEIPEWDTWTIKSRLKAIYALISFVALVFIAMGPAIVVALLSINSVIALTVVKTIPNINDDDDD